MRIHLTGEYRVTSEPESGGVSIMVNEIQKVEHHVDDAAPVPPGWEKVAPGIIAGPMKILSGQVVLTVTGEAAVAIGEKLVEDGRATIAARAELDEANEQARVRLAAVPPLGFIP